MDQYQLTVLPPRSSMTDKIASSHFLNFCYTHDHSHVLELEKLKNSQYYVESISNTCWKASTQDTFISDTKEQSESESE
eukprot:gene10847-12635_t